MLIMKRLLTVLLLIASVHAAAEPLPQLSIYTEHYEPYNFIDQTEQPAKLREIGVELLEDMLARVGAKQTRTDFRVVTLENGFKAVEQKRNSVLFSIARTDERENNFKWVCPIDQLRTQLVGLKSRDLTLNNDDDLKNYDIGTIKGDVGEELLKKAGIPQSRLSYGNEYNNLNKLINGQTDLYVVSMDNVASSCKNRSCDVSQFEPVYTLKVTDLCYAINKATADSVVTQLQSALDELRDKGRVKALKDKYAGGG